MTLPRRRLGTTDLEITRVGLGAWAIGGGGWKFGWGDQDDSDSVAAIRTAVERGINWVDTAPIYGLGRSEQVVGKALRDIPEPDRPLVFTKCGLVWEGDGSAGPSNVLAPDSMRREVDASLERLGVERIDLYQVHWPPEDGTALEEYWAVMEELRQAGKVRAIGLSNHDVTQARAAEQIAHVDSLQPPLSLISRDAAGDLVPWAEANRTGVIVYSPMQSGLLTGAMTRERAAALPEDDWRSTHEDFTGEGLERNLAVVEAMRPIAERHDVGLSAVAVAWVLSWPGVTGAIVGARDPGQLEGWLPAAALELDDRDLDELAEALTASSAGSGPRRPERSGTQEG